MKKLGLVIATTITITAMGITSFAACVREPADAGTLKQDPFGKYWEYNMPKEKLEDVWSWMDVDGDGKAEKVYFGEDGYLVPYTEVNGQYIDGNGNILEEGVIVR